MTEIANPANEAGTIAERTRVPMNLPEQKLFVPPIEGYRLYWFRGEPGRLQRAKKAGYDFVRPEEVDLNNFDLGGDLTQSGNSDASERVSMPAQDGAGEDGQYLRLFLMKIKEEWFIEDQIQYEQKKIQPIVDSFMAGTIGAGKGDASNRYVKDWKPPSMFTNKRKV